MAEDKKSKQLKRFSPSKRNTNKKKIDEYLTKRQADTKLPSQVYSPVDTTGRPDYTETTTRKNVRVSPSVKPNEDMSNRATTYTDKYPKYETSSSSSSMENTSSMPTESNKETATGTLSAKTETTSSDRMSWAREAEKKARKMMGGR